MSDEELEDLRLPVEWIGPGRCELAVVLAGGALVVAAVLVILAAW